MSTIDELAPASSASDSDEFIVSQAGIARKITRAQVLNGVQSQLAVPSGSLLGNSGSGIGMPEVITVGRNLNFDGSTLSATAAPFIISALPNGTVPLSGDLVSMSQAGTSVAVTYGQLVNGIAGIPNIKSDTSFGDTDRRDYGPDPGSIDRCHAALVRRHFDWGPHPIWHTGRIDAGRKQGLRG